ncbi:hypothetical protein COUCH_15790 [Couchioplanes caeruleus]|uniref:hypothetical protein n=1 Tax=Couchioplanes caeruleus TaxID=56438 RepID=UPI0020BE1C35|nr:hypothetical protein [Couchioplanes caeruleus]UQU67642.1 hypothetical protein COUCH_15790 [Couchioplanes caeruleus]
MSTFLRLPVNPDEGFPQSFRLVFGNRSYVFGLAVHIAEEVLPDATTPEGLAAAVTLPAPGAYLVMTVIRDDVTGGTVLLRRKVIPGLVYRAGELALVVRSARIAIGNLHGAGAYRSEVVAGVAG